MIRNLKREDEDQVTRLLKDNPYKQDQIRFQRLNAENLVEFHKQRIIGRINDLEKPIIAIEESGKFGLCGFEISKNHSDFFHKLVFSVSPVLTYNLEAEQKEALLEEVIRASLSIQAQILWFQFSEEESDWNSIIAQRDGAYCGTDLRLSLRLKGPNSDSPKGIRLAREEDLKSLRSIATKGHQHSHFFRDPFLDAEAKKRLFPEYLESSFGRSSRILWVAEDDGGEPLGFSLLILPENQESVLGRSVGIVDFIVVAPEAQGHGVGQLLLEKSHQTFLERGYEYVELKTMLDNRGAVNFYQRNGYRLLSSEVRFSLGIGEN